MRDAVAAYLALRRAAGFEMHPFQGVGALPNLDG
jgi:hypothetical protein